MLKSVLINSLLIILGSCLFAILSYELNNLAYHSSQVPANEKWIFVKSFYGALFSGLVINFISIFFIVVLPIKKLNFYFLCILYFLGSYIFIIFIRGGGLLLSTSTMILLFTLTTNALFFALLNKCLVKKNTKE